MPFMTVASFAFLPFNVTVTFSPLSTDKTTVIVALFPLICEYELIVGVVLDMLYTLNEVEFLNVESDLDTTSAV